MQRWLQVHIPPVSAGKEETIILGGQTIAGFLILPDGSERPINIPSTYYADFRTIAEANAFVRDYTFNIDELQIKPPFAFVFGLRLNTGCCYYITSADVLTNQTAAAWRLIPLEGAKWNPIREMRAVPLP